MRSRHNARTLIGVVVLAVLFAAALPAQEPAPAGSFSQEEIASTLADVKRDPNLGGESTFKMIRWREGDRPAQTDGGWLSWIGGFFEWLMQSARYLMWAAIVLFAAWLGVYLTRAIRARSAEGTIDAFVPPTHVRDLDIRPESLPANIGDAARALWDRGDHRAALSLLYRGLLSRLTHVHRVPIHDSSTEGDCLSLLTGRVPTETGEYSAQLVDAWRAFVYGGSPASSPAVHALCAGFAGALDRAVPRPVEGGGQ